MLHLFLISQLIVVVFANPFLKYPYVFLLDVGNEEIGKLNTEQIRLTIPGGSLAVRYPAVGEGATIGHIRVSGIDFGTDLKASIIQGGPGYKYAVFVFMGNQGVPYDAVVTIQTLPNTEASTPNLDSTTSNTHEIEEANDSSEDTSDESEKTSIYDGNVKSQIMQSSSNVYQFASSDDAGVDDLKSENSEVFQDQKGVSDDYNDDVNNQNFNDHAKREYFEDRSNEDVRVVHVNRNQNGIYEAFKPHWYGGVRFYPQAGMYTQDSYGKSVYDADNDEQDEKENQNEISAQNYKDANNNENNDYGSPVEY